jgi:hypothetical protein
MSNRLRVLTWHVHGNYLLYLSQARVDFFLPVKPGRSEGYGGRGSVFPFGGNIQDVPAEQVRDLPFDCILFQNRKNFTTDQHEILSDEQKRLPRIYLEHDPPQEHPTNARHWVDDANTLLVHVTPFNALMWNSGGTPTKVIDHGVFVPEGIHYTGELERGIVVVNHLRQRGRLVGADLFELARQEIPLDLVGMDAESMGGVGEISPPRLAAFESHYRFFFHPLRYTSLGLALLEAMMVGMPIVGLATTELVTVIENGRSGFVSTDPEKLLQAMRLLLADAGAARRMGQEARRVALERFSITRFAHDWEQTFAQVAGRPADSPKAARRPTRKKAAALAANGGGS